MVTCHDAKQRWLGRWHLGAGHCRSMGRMPRHGRGTGAHGDHSGMWELERYPCPAAGGGGKGQPGLRAAWWELQDCCMERSCPSPHWWGLDALPCSRLSQCQALSLLPLAPALWGTPIWGQPREPDGGQRRAPRLQRWSTSAVRKDWENWDCSAWTGPGAPPGQSPGEELAAPSSLAGGHHALACLEKGGKKIPRTGCSKLSWCQAPL